MLDDLVLHRMVEAPVGPFPLVEAAFSWRARRPSQWRQIDHRSAVHRVSRIPHKQLANRFARLLYMLTIPNVVDDHVEVPTGDYQRVLRAFGASLRLVSRAFGDRFDLAARTDIAVALWRAGMLATGSRINDQEIMLSLADPRMAHLLVDAAHALELSVHSRRQHRVLHLSSRRDIRKLVALTSGLAPVP